MLLITNDLYYIAVTGDKKRYYLTNRLEEAEDFSWLNLCMGKKKVLEEMNKRFDIQGKKFYFERWR